MTGSVDRSHSNLSWAIKCIARQGPDLTPPHTARNARIDVLRGIAICAVLLLHFTLAYGLKNSPLGTWLAPQLLKAIAYNGNFGVTIFFVISGFLITSNSLSRWGDLKDIDLRSFYLLRVARIMPSLLLVLAIIVPWVRWACRFPAIPTAVTTCRHRIS